jgi:signal transduction histidine kinase
VSGTCFFSMTVLFFVWLFTCGALVLSLKRQRSSREPASLHSDLLIGLVSEKYREAIEASKRLREVADALHIGLVELEGRQIKEMNQSALDLLPEDEGHRQTLTEIMTSLEVDSPKVVELDNEIVQLRRLTTSGSQDLVLIQDITESFLMARRLKQQEKLALLGQMAAQMSHQIKTPIAVMAGQAQMLARHLDNDPGLWDQANSIYLEARDLARQVNEISNFYRKREPYFRDTDLCQVLHEVKKRLDSLGRSC